MRRVFLDEVNTLYGHFTLVWPSSTEFALRTGKYCARFGIDEQFGYLAVTQPFRVFIHQLNHVGRLPIYGNLPGPGQCWASIFSGIDKWPSVNFHLLFSQFSEYGSWKHTLDEKILRSAYDQFVADFDPQFGGFSKAPKFPPSMSLQILLRMHHRARDPKALEIVEKTLDRMGRGGIYDHLGGGFHRYSTDNQWLVPHFEKMLYDNALLAWTYLEAYQITGKRMYSDIVRGILDYVLSEMTNSQGGFYSAQDAGGIGEEGIFYVWSASELKQHLTSEELALFEKVYGVTEAGNFEGGHNVLALQDEYNWEIKEHPLIESAHHKLMMARRQRSAPLKDDKILTAWNGLMIAAMAKAYQVLGEEIYLQAAQQGARFLKQNLMKNGKLLRRYRGGEVAFSGYLGDYAYLIAGLLALYEADFDPAWANWARDLQAKQHEIFWDDQLGAYYYSRADDPNLIRRSVDFNDGALPNSNAVSALNLLKLHDTFGHPTTSDPAHFADIKDFEYFGIAEECLSPFGREHAAQHVLHVVRKVVNYRVIPNVYIFPLRQFSRLGIGANIKSNDESIRCLRQANIGFVDAPNTGVKNPDLYFVGTNIPGADEYIKAANMYLSDRTLFGTAYPSRPLPESVEAFDAWEFEAGVKEKILYKNALRVMKMDESG